MSARVNFTLDKKFLEAFDEKIKDNGYTNRSQAIVEAMRDFIDKLNQRQLMRMKVKSVNESP
jgi:metal-responsive CopG/Arc/MetJ family transcriptional regulator